MAFRSGDCASKEIVTNCPAMPSKVHWSLSSGMSIAANLTSPDVIVPPPVSAIGVAIGLDVDVEDRVGVDVGLAVGVGVTVGFGAGVAVAVGSAKTVRLPLGPQEGI